ncbi:MAG: SpoIIE family protein phosphatase [Frankiales bacterium]|nr:SpoIIE family protein phosphatase [Frankiales bacterium]
MELDAESEAAREGRQFVGEQLRARDADGLVDDGMLVAAELIANACQHGLPPISVCVIGAGDRVRIEVRDGSARSPVRPSQSMSNMTGRGLALVDALARQWGVERQEEGGKTVWAELSIADEQGLDDVDVDTILARWQDEFVPTEEQHYTVVLGDVPTDLLIGAKAHIDNLVREFTLAAAAAETTEAEVPPHLARLIQTVVHGFGDARDAIKRQALAAARNGEPRTRLVLHLPASAADAGEAYLAALDEADEYSRAARLLTLETPADHRLFRRWYVEAVIAQLRQLAAGQTPDPVMPFEERLVTEVRRLTSMQRVSDRAARLQRVTAALARTRTPEDVAGVVLREGVAALDASGGGMLVPAGDGEHLAVPGVVGYGEELLGALRSERADAELPAATALRTGEPIWLESQDQRDHDFPALRGFEADTVAMCAVPLIVGDRAIGALRFSFAGRKLFDEDERRFVLALAAQTAQTLQRTELYQAEREAALDLQRALLPQDLPPFPGWDIATYYSPAGGQEAGGDFYDVLPVSGGRIVAVVGDVMGRGVEAAAAMAQVRSTIRAYAIDDPDPVSVFRRIDRFFETLAVEQLVTVLYFLVDADHDRVHIANAGHLAPLIVDANGSRSLPTASGTPFGVGEVDRDVTTVELPPGSALVAITDGLVERRGEDIDEGVARVIEATTQLKDWTAQSLLDHVVDVAAHARAHDDDVTVLVLRRGDSS